MTTVNRTVQPTAPPFTVHRSVDPYARTDGRTNGEGTHLEEGSHASNARVAQPPLGLVYLVEWPAAGFHKVGFAVDDRRWRAYCGHRGGQLVLLLPGHPLDPTGRIPHATIVESRIHTALRSAGARPAFTTKADAASYLGHRGAGWTECYAGHWDLALQLLLDAHQAASRRTS